MHEASLELPYADSLYAAIARAKLTYLQRAIDVSQLAVPATGCVSCCMLRHHSLPPTAAASCLMAWNACLV